MNACSQLHLNSPADYQEAEKLVGNKLQRARHSLRRYCSVPNSQRDLDHVTWLKLGIFLCDKALPTSQPAPNDGNFRSFPPISRTSCGSDYGGVLNLLCDALEPRSYLVDLHASAPGVPAPRRPYAAHRAFPAVLQCPAVAALKHQLPRLFAACASRTVTAPRASVSLVKVRHCTFTKKVSDPLQILRILLYPLVLLLQLLSKHSNLCIGLLNGTLKKRLLLIIFMLAALQSLSSRCAICKSTDGAIGASRRTP